MKKANRFTFHFAFSFALLWKLLALEALFNHQSGQRWGFLSVLRGVIDRESWNRLILTVPERLNVTPPFAGLLLGMWRKDLMRDPKNSRSPFPVESLSSTLSARADCLLWGAGQPAIFSLALVVAILGGSGVILAAPILWIAFVIGLQIWGWEQARQRSLDELICFVGSNRWSIWEQRLGRTRRVAVGVVLGYWIMGGVESGMDLLRYAAPGLGLILVLIWKITPLKWGVVVLLLALVLLGQVVMPNGVVP